MSSLVSERTATTESGANLALGSALATLGLTIVTGSSSCASTTTQLRGAGRHVGGCRAVQEEGWHRLCGCGRPHRVLDAYQRRVSYRVYPPRGVNQYASLTEASKNSAKAVSLIKPC
jgi:hypothetical protein